MRDIRIIFEGGEAGEYPSKIKLYVNKMAVRDIILCIYVLCSELEKIGVNTRKLLFTKDGEAIYELTKEMLNYMDTVRFSLKKSEE